MWDRRTGAFLADFSGGHEDRIFGVAMDCTKVSGRGDNQLLSVHSCASICPFGRCIYLLSQLVSCGEDEVSIQRRYGE